MKNGKCPKCSSAQVYKKKCLGHRSYIYVTLLSFARVTDYVCTDCGFTESYLLDGDKLNKIKGEWEKA